MPKFTVEGGSPSFNRKLASLLSREGLPFSKVAKTHVRRDSDRTFCGLAASGVMGAKRVAILAKVPSAATCAKCRAGAR